MYCASQAFTTVPRHPPHPQARLRDRCYHRFGMPFATRTVQGGLPRDRQHLPLRNTLTMLRKLLFLIPSLLVLGFLGFYTTASAATAVSGDDASIVDLTRPVYDAFENHQYGLMVCLLVILLVAFVKRYLGDKVPFLHTDTGGSLLVLVGAMATAAGAGLATPGAHVTLTLLKTALMVGVTAAGGFAMLKNLLVDPILKPLAAKAPAWMQPLFSVLFFAFDHGTSSEATIAKAVVVGEKAVVASPGAGASAIVGLPTDVK